MSKGKKSIQGGTNTMIKDRHTQRKQHEEKKVKNDVTSNGLELRGNMNKIVNTRT